MRKIETVISKSASVVDCAKRDFEMQGSEAAFAISILHLLYRLYQSYYICL